MYVPPAVPALPGQVVRLTVGGLNRPEFANLGENPIDATIVRVDRKSLLSMGHLAVGLKFA